MFKPYERNKRETDKLFKLIGNRTKLSKLIKRLLQNNLHEFMLIKDSINEPLYYRDLLELGENTRLVVEYNKAWKTTILRVYSGDNKVSVTRYIDDSYVLMIHEDTYNNPYRSICDTYKYETVFMIDTNSPYEDILEQIQEEELGIIDMTRYSVRVGNRE